MTPTTLLHCLTQAIVGAGELNQSALAPPAVILWTDAGRQWESVLPVLRAITPQLLTLGTYDPTHRSGPAIWLKCVIAGALPEVSLPLGTVPILYLPGVSRSDLRAIESCPRELQPLAELQYRGVFWSQANAKDWTVSAYLSSKNGGLNLDLLHDQATQDALRRALEAGVLLDHSLAELQSRQINAAWLDSLLAPNPTRDILVWLNDPQQAQARWAGGRWDVFVNRCKKDFGFSPLADGPLVAAEKLAGRTGSWSAVWELYRDSWASFPGLVEQLSRIQPPTGRDLFDDVSGYPVANEEAEAALRYQLHSVGTMAAPQARAALQAAEKSNAERRRWLWARMGRAPLAQALQHLAVVAELSSQIPNGATPDQMADKYRDGGWRVDAAALKALAAVTAKTDIEAVSGVLGATYVPWLEDSARRFQELVTAQSGLSPAIPAGQSPHDGLCTVFVDGLRYDVANELMAHLEGIGAVTLSSAWTSIPSVTASGKAWASPVAQAVAGKQSDEDFEPSVVSDGKPLNTYNFRKLLTEQNVQVLEKHQTGDPSGRAWVECGDLDHYGHEHGLRLARDLNSQLDHIVERLVELKEAGWSKFRVVTDHGWLLVPRGLPKAELSKHETQTRWGRCAVLKDSSHGTPLTFGWDWCKSVQIAMAPGIANFVAGAEYAHGGLTLQECLVPVLDIQVAQSKVQQLKVDITKVTWKGLRCYVELAPALDGLRVDIRTKVALAESSVVAKVKPVEGGKGAVAVDDDSLLGTAAVVVVLDANDNVVQKTATTIGE